MAATAPNSAAAPATEASGIGFFEKYLTLWVALCIAAGVAIGVFLPVVPQVLSRFEYYSVSLPVAILIWLMIFPMMLKVDFSSIKRAGARPKGLIVTLVMNWLIKPFTMYIIAWFFLKVVFRPFIPEDLALEYIAGAVLLGAAPCTAMVFVWSQLTKGDAGYTLVQVAVNDLILLFAYAPIVMLLLAVGSVPVPFATVFLSVVLFIVIPLVAAWAVRAWLVNQRGAQWFEQDFLPRVSHITPIGLLITLVLLFSFQGQTILDNGLHIALIAVPLTLQTLLIFALAYLWSRLWKIPHCVAAPAGMIGASNFFELAVAVAIALFGLQSGAALATVVGVLVEVPVMLFLVRIANKTKPWYQRAVPGE